MTSQEVFKTVCKPGYWFVNVALLGDAPDWVQQQIQPEQNEKTIFGYETASFMAKQYCKVKG